MLLVDTGRGNDELTIGEGMQQDLQGQGHGTIAQGLIQVYRVLGGGWEIHGITPEPTWVEAEWSEREPNEPELIDPLPAIVN